jgi:hypothetical protein
VGAWRDRPRGSGAAFWSTIARPISARLHATTDGEVIVQEYVKPTVVRNPNDLDWKSHDPGFSYCQTFAASLGKLDFP